MDERQNDERPEEAAPVQEQPGTGPSGEGMGPGGAGRQGEARDQAPQPPGALPPGPGGAEPPLPPELQAAEASKDDRNMAMIAHLLGLVGFLGPLILYLVKKDEADEYVRFHIKQSLWFQIWANIAAFGLAIISIPLMYVCIGIVTFLLAVLVGMGAWIYAIIGAVQTSSGKDFEYLWVGPWVRRSMM